MATPLTKVITNPTTPDPLTCCWMCLCWFPPSAWVTPLHLHLITLWARESSQSSRAKVTSSDSHREICNSPGAEVKYLNAMSELQKGTSVHCSNSTQRFLHVCEKHEWYVEVGLKKWRSTGSLDESCCRRPIKLSSFYRTQSIVEKHNNVEKSKAM